MKYVMKGGSPLVGEVTVNGAKNAALGVLTASIMADETVMVDNLPDVMDIKVLLSAFEEIGVAVERPTRHSVRLNGANIFSACADSEYVKKIRGSYYLLGALLGKYHHAEVAMPGGCNIGTRPIDQHLKGFRLLGAEVSLKDGKVILDARELHGAHIYLDMASVGATINLMMAAAMAKGNTIIENAAKEPHIVDVANMLNSMGANVKGAGMDVIIRAVESGEAAGYAFLLKILLTAVTLSSGFKGGEVVPSFFVGAVFGCAFGKFLGIPAGFAGAIGLICVFCGAVNCPIASMFLSVELFGAEGLLYFALACGLSYVLSGYSGIYSSQRILYDKLKAQYIDVRTNAHEEGEHTEMEQKYS